jgi:nitroimidazol reductase NimA-like FMN-containing flavoprotein (pyridoxamine 5'-phosphate oxidase superfamily)
VVSDREEKARFCSELMRKYGDATWARPREFDPRLDEITVYRNAIERMTGKETALPVTSRRWPQLDQTKSPNAIPPEPQ